MTVLLFARVRDIVGSARIEFEDAATVGELRRRLATRFPQIADLVKKSAIAVNDEFADDAAAIPRGAEVALLPPVSGG
ncbi:MAG: molybdopterin converting factor subunit 1 [Planctomycetes bacterium]|nr:molybdopterin converting factor subunit 1 [Planctomycetota bacterium]